MASTIALLQEAQHKTEDLELRVAQSTNSMQVGIAQHVIGSCMGMQWMCCMRFMFTLRQPMYGCKCSLPCMAFMRNIVCCMNCTNRITLHCALSGDILVGKSTAICKSVLGRDSRDMGDFMLRTSMHACLAGNAGCSNICQSKGCKGT